MKIDTSNLPFEFISPSQCRDWIDPADLMLCGDSHFTRGGITVLAGVPGAGKSRLAYALAVAGATGDDWMGHPVHSRFRTLILQSENGIARLKSEFSDIDTGDVDLDDYLRITPPPAKGLRLSCPDFRDYLRSAISDFGAGVLVIDPWNNVVEGSNPNDRRVTVDAMNALNDALPTNPAEKPAVVIVTHLRNQFARQKHKRGLNRFSEVRLSPLATAARCVFMLDPVSPDLQNDRVVLTCVKNANGDLGAASAWYHHKGLFQPYVGFDWKLYNER